MAHPASQALFLSRLRNGAELEDAVLALVHGAMAEDRQVANEFLAYFLNDVLRTGRPMLSPALRTFLDTWDLAQSVFGDLWPQLLDVRFESRAQFLSLLRQRLSWKASNRARGLASHLRTASERAESVDPPDDAPSPERLADLREAEERMILAMVRLPERDRALLEAHLRGESAGDLARRFG